MKLTQEQLQLASNCASAEELYTKAQEAGFDITQEQANDLFKQFEFANINDEDMIDTVAGGCGTTAKCGLCQQVKRCPYAISHKGGAEWACCDSCYEQYKNNPEYSIRNRI